MVATQEELVALDGEGNVRARAALDPETPPSCARRGARRRTARTVYALTASGAVVAWVPAPGRDASRSAPSAEPATAEWRSCARTDRRGPRGRHRSGARRARPGDGRLTTRAVAASSGALALLGPPSVRRTGSCPSSASPPHARSRSPSTRAEPRRSTKPWLPPGLPTLPDGGAALGASSPTSGRWSIRTATSPSRSPRVSSAWSPPAGRSTSSARSAPGSAPPLALASLGIRGGPTFAGLAPAAPSAIVVGMRERRRRPNRQRFRPRPVSMPLARPDHAAYSADRQERSRARSGATKTSEEVSQR